MYSNKKVAIIDYGMGNLFSVKQACEHAGLNAAISSEFSEILDADAVILSGVGAFGVAMHNLEKLELINPIKNFINSGKPFMGICLGMQLLMSVSEEFGYHKGLNVIKGSVVRFSDTKESNRIKVPQVGWNQIVRPGFIKEEIWNFAPLRDINNGEVMYFVHSYYVVPEDPKLALSFTKYGDIEYCSSILYKNIFACQFHPEKSGREGLKIYKNWLVSYAKKN